MRLNLSAVAPGLAQFKGYQPSQLRATSWVVSPWLPTWFRR